MDETITLKQIREAKTKLSNKMVAALEEFTDTTGLYVIDVDLISNIVNLTNTKSRYKVWMEIDIGE